MDLEKRRKEFLVKIRESRTQSEVKDVLHRLRIAAENQAYLFPIVLDAVKVHVTIGEIMQVFEEVFGRYKEQPVF